MSGFLSEECFARISRRFAGGRRKVVLPGRIEVTPREGMHEMKKTSFFSVIVAAMASTATAMPTVSNVKMSVSDDREVVPCRIFNVHRRGDSRIVRLCAR